MFAAHLSRSTESHVLDIGFKEEERGLGAPPRVNQAARTNLRGCGGETWSKPSLSGLWAGNKRFTPRLFVKPALP
jgi:hypothetical protein